MTHRQATTRRKLRVVLLADETLLPLGDLKDFSEKQRELRKTEFDVRDGLETLGHEVVPIGVSNDLATIRGAIDAHKPHIVFNLVEEFDGIGHFDQHVVSYLELCKQPYTGCNPRGLTLARDKALTKKVLAYDGMKVPEFVVFPPRRALKRPERLGFPLFVKPLAEEGSAGISASSIVHNDEQLSERVAFIHSTTGAAAIAEEFIEGREIYVGVLGNNRIMTLPPWEFRRADKRDEDRPLVATDRAKWDPEYQRQHGLKTGRARLSGSTAGHLATVSKRIYRKLGLSGYARLDFRLTETGEAYLLEANPNAQIAKDEDFARSAQHVGFSYPDLLEKLLRLGMSYVPSTMVV